MIRSWTFQRKVTAGFAVMVGLAAIIAGIAVYALHTVVNSRDHLHAVNARNLTDAQRLLADSSEYVAAFRGFLLLTEDRFLDQRRKAAAADKPTECFVAVLYPARPAGSSRRSGHAQTIGIADRTNEPPA